jgi:hypothetical protein
MGWMPKNLSEATIVSLPSGQSRSLPHQAELPDLLPLGPLSIELDPHLERGIYCAFDVSNNVASLVLRDLVGNSTLWHVEDQAHLLGSGYGYNWAWSPDGNFVALTFSANSSASPSSIQGDLFILSKDGAVFQQISAFSASEPADYFVVPGSWAPDGQRLLIEVRSANGTRAYVVDFSDRVIIDTCLSSVESSTAAWSPDSTMFAGTLQQDGQGGSGLVIYNVDLGSSFQPSNVSAIQSIGGWLP